MRKCYKTGKQMFLTRAPAEKAMSRLKRSNHSQQGSIYLCQYCHTYHITHWGYECQEVMDRYDDRQKLSKKELRSKRKKTIFTNRYTKENNIMRRITPLIPNSDGRMLNAQLSAAAGELKMFLGGQNNAAILTLQYAMDLLKSECPRYGNLTKREFGKALNELARYEWGLLHPAPGQVRLFHLDDFSPSERAQYKKDMTDEEYLEFWQATGGELYAKTIPYAKAFAWKFERHFNRIGMKDGAKAMAWAVVTDNLLALCVETYDHVCKNCAQHLCTPVSPGLDVIFDVLSLRRLSQAWHRACNLLTASRERMTDLEAADFKSAMSTIAELWTDPTVYFDGIGQSIDSYSEDVFEDKKQCKEAKKSTNKMRREVAEEIDKIKRNSILKKA